MACSSCGAAKVYAKQKSQRSVEIPVMYNSEECVYSKENIEDEINNLTIKLEKEPLRSKRINIRIKIIKLKQALKEYDSNCNKYLNNLYELL